MKKLVSVLMALIMVFAMGTIAFAETTVTDEAGLIAALASGGEIKLANDVTLDTKITVPDGTVIDLNGKTLFVNVENSSYSNATIKNGNIVLGKDDVHVCDGYFLIVAGKTLVLNEVAVSSAEGGIKGYCVFNILTGANLDLISSSVNISENEYSSGYIVYAGESSATLDITDSTIIGSKTNGVVHATTVMTKSTFTLTDAVEHGINRSAVTIDSSDVTISGGTGRGITAQHGDLIVKGDSVVNISDMGEATIELRNDKSFTVSDEAKVAVDERVKNTTSGTVSGTVNVDKSVGKAAKIGDKYYKTIEEAVDKVENGETIVLLENVSGSFDIEDGEEVVIDLNKKTLKLDPAHGSAGTETNGSRVLYGGKLTIKNGTIECGTESSVPGKTLKVGIANYGELTLEDVTFNASETVRYTINNRGILNLKGKTTVNENKNPVDSAYDANHKVWAITNDPYDYVPAEDGSVNAELNVEDEEVSVGPVQVEQYTRKNNSDAKIELNIKAGTFAGIYSDGEEAMGVEGNITGGTFGNDVSEYLAEGYLVDENGSVRRFKKASISSNLAGKEFKLFKLGYFTVSVEMNDEEEVVGYLELDDTENLIRLEQKVNGVWEEIEEFTFEGVTEDTEFELRAIYSKEGEYTFTAGVGVLVPGSTAPDYYDTIGGSFEVEFKVTTLPNNRPSSKPVEKPETETEKNPNTGAPVFAPAIILVSAAAAFFKKR